MTAAMTAPETATVTETAPAAATAPSAAQPPAELDFAALQGLSRRFCQAVEAIQFDDIPQDVIETVKLFVLDTLGVIGGAKAAPGIQDIAGRVHRWDHGGSATNLLTGAPLSPPHAAMLNGAAAHALDFDDMHDPARIHSFCVIFPALTAAAQDIGTVDGKRFLLGLTLAAEIHARLGFTCYNSLGKGWHPTMTLGVLAAALGIGRLLDQKGERLLNTLGLAQHQICGSAQSMLDGVLSKRLGAGFAARGAVTAAFLAEDGITGPFVPLEGNAGLFKLQERGEVRPEELLKDFGQLWQTRGYSFKPYPCCRCNHSSISLAIRLKEQGLTPDQVEAVEILLPQVNYQTVGIPYEPARDSVVHAQFNCAYSFARALTDGRIDLRSYTRPNITDPDIAALAARVTVKPDPDQPPTEMGPSRITVTRRDGSQIQIRETLTPGSPECPLSPEEVIAKFRQNMNFGTGIAPEALEPIIDKVMTLESLTRVDELFALFSAVTSG